jgi:outer membrane biosynthesis protein TonB
MASGEPQPPGREQRHTGVVRGGFARRPAQTPRRDWIAGGIVAGITVGAMLIVLNAFGSRPAEVALLPTPTSAPSVESTLPVFVQETPAPTPTPTPAPTPAPTPSPTPLPTPTPSPTPTTTPSLTPSATTPLVPSPSPTPSATEPATPEATALPTPGATPEPSQPAIALKITAPKDGATVNDGVVVIKGKAAPGATITRDVPLWFDEHTVADEKGRWSFEEALNVGENSFTFRVADDRSTEVTLTVFLAAE